MKCRDFPILEESGAQEMESFMTCGKCLFCLFFTTGVLHSQTVASVDTFVL